MHMPSISCGTLVFEPRGDLLLCHLTGTPYWDIPKGLLDPGESEREAALREVQEECGLRLHEASSIELGRFRYRPRKDLHLFAVLHDRIDAACLKCQTIFTDRHGLQRPEVDAYAWAPPSEVERRCAPSLAAVLLRRIDLTDVLRRLKALSSR